jgi:hypothetical protein
MVGRCVKSALVEGELWIELDGPGTGQIAAVIGEADGLAAAIAIARERADQGLGPSQRVVIEHHVELFVHEPPGVLGGPT